ncbi:MAG: hypothetical protein A2542_01335 [Parcubacteria group bacterium RIFOXYD2_FULL_52_8]|nr:ribosomal protein L15 [uncultured bacterium]OHB24350.1 MAG: hypothetical protein A2542_01335 [Parcubacteria group bacterium RIFOXYD2_FULL_52_8]
MQIHHITRSHKQAKRKTVGRGGKRGKTSGRGTKGQNARAGHKKRPEVRDIIKKLPKLRGRGVNGLRTIQLPAVVVNVADLETLFSAGALVTPHVLRSQGVIAERMGRAPRVKILGTGALTKALIVKECLVSASAKEKILKAGGSVA